MKIRTLLFITATITFSALKAQDYEIDSVTPDTLDKGINILTITLNKEIVNYDSITVYYDGTSWDYLSAGNDVSWTDSIITATVDVHEYTQNQEVNLRIMMINTTDWSYEELVYDKSITIHKKIHKHNIEFVDSEILITGELNSLEIHMDTTLVWPDSAYVSIMAYTDGAHTNTYINKSEYITDSMIYVTFDIPDLSQNEVGILYVELFTYVDYCSQFLVYNDTLFINDGISNKDYQIQNVTPNTLISGIDNEITVTLNREIAAEDSAFVIIHGYFLDGSPYGQYYPISNDPADSVLYWNDSTITAIINIPDLSEMQQGILEVEMINTEYWTSTILTNEDTLTIGGTIHSFAPEICMVSVDSLNRNMIIWNPEYEEYVDSVIIYKEIAVADEFELIGKRSIEDTPLFVDEKSENSPNSNRYCIAFQDTSGVFSKMSLPHKTMHLTMNVGINGAINLIWEKYEGFEYSTFYIYRGSKKGEMVKIAEIPSNLFTFTDQNPSLFHLYYQVVIEHPSPCDISMQKSAQDIFSSTKSNFVEYTVVSNELLEDSEYTINIYPNPVSDYLTISIDNFPVKVFDVAIHDLSGRAVQNFASIHNGSKIELSTLKSGMYILNVNYNGASQNKLFVKE